MEKEIINITPVDYKTILFNKQAISVKSYINIEEKASILSNYIDKIKQDNDFVINYLEAEYGLMAGIIELNTNISLDTNNLNSIIESGLWDLIKLDIINYEEIRKDIDSLMCLYKIDKEIEVSVEKMISRILNKMSSLMDEIIKMDLNKESLSKMLGDLVSSAKNLKTEDIVSLVEDKIVQEKPKRARTKKNV